MMRIIYFALTILLLAGFSVPAEAQRKGSFMIATAGSGVDGIRVGRSTRADVIKKYGRNFKTIKHGTYSAQMKYPNGVSYYYCQKEPRQQIFDIELRSPARVKTAKGLVLNTSSVKEIYKKYGKPLNDGLRFRGIEFYYRTTSKGKIITVIDIVEKSGMRQCKE